VLVSNTAAQWAAATLGATPRGMTPRTTGGFKTAGASTLRGILASRPPKSEPVGGSYQRSFKSAYEELARQQELQHITAMFRAVDSDGSGEVNYTEFQTCMQDPAMYKILHRRFGFQRHETPRIFRALDADGSGTVSVEEWLSTCKLLMDVVKEGQVIENWRVNEVRKMLKSCSSQDRSSSASSPRRASPRRKHQ